MRKIEQAMIDAIKSHREFKMANTAVLTSGPDIVVTLHGNTIARNYSGVWQWTLAGWNTATTRSHINALARELGLYRVCTKGGASYAVRQDNTRFLIGDDEWVNA